MMYKVTISWDPGYDEWLHKWDDGISVSFISEERIKQFLIDYLEICYGGCDRSLKLEALWTQ